MTYGRGGLGDKSTRSIVSISSPGSAQKFKGLSPGTGTDPDASIGVCASYSPKPGAARARGDDRKRVRRAEAGARRMMAG